MLITESDGDDIPLSAQDSALGAGAGSMVRKQPELESLL